MDDPLIKSFHIYSIHPSLNMGMRYRVEIQNKAALYVVRDFKSMKEVKEFCKSHGLNLTLSLAALCNNLKFNLDTSEEK